VDRESLAVGTAGATRSLAGGMLATALVVYVGRDGSAFAVGMLSTAFFAASTVCTPLWGALGDLTGRRRALLLVVGVAAAALSLSFVFVRSVWGFVGVRAVYATAVAGFSPLVLSLLRETAPPARRGRAAGFLSSAMAAGDVVAQATVGVLLLALSRTALFSVVAAVGAVGVAALFALPRSPPGTDAPATLGAVVDGVVGRLVPTPAERALLRERGLDRLYAGLAVRHAAVKGVGSLVPLFLLARLGATPVTMGLLLTVSPAAQVGLMRVAGAAVDDAARVKPLLVGGVLASALYGPVLAVAGAVAGPGRYAVAVAAFLAIAVGFSAMDMASVAVVGDAVPASRESTFLGLRSTAAGVGGVVGPALVGVAVAAFGFGVGFALAGVVGGAAVAVVAGVEPPEAVPDRPFDPAVETATGIGRPTRADDD
jgi:MFS family permease